MATWKKIITSGSTAELNHISASGNILPVTDNTSDLGATGQEFKDLYIDGVAYLDGAQIGTLGAALDANNQAITNINVDGGAIDGTDIGANSAGTIAGTTIDASTDFTIGGTVITDSKITDDGTFTIDAATDIELNADGGDIIIKDNTAPVATININTISGSSISTGSFGTLHLEGTNFTSASLAAAIANDGDITGVDLTGQTGGITIDSETNTTSGNYSANIQLPTALTVPSSIKNNSLVIGRVAADDLITFTAGDISLGIGGTERLGIDANGIQVTGNAVISGDLTVNGDLTTIATTNTLVEDQFMFLGTGSAASNKDIGIIAQSGSAVDSGSAFYHDINSERWSVAKGISSIGVAATPLQFVTTVKTSTSTPGASDGDFGVGEMWVDTDDSEPTGNGVVYIRTA